MTKALFAAFVALLYLGFLAGCTGCSERGEHNSSVLFTFDTAALAKASALSDVRDGKVTYTLKLVLQGDYTATRTVRFVHKRDYLTIKFTGVPTGAKIYATADVYEGELRVCSGTSGYSIVRAGDNLLSLAMHSVDDAGFALVVPPAPANEETQASALDLDNSALEVDDSTLETERAPEVDESAALALSDADALTTAAQPATDAAEEARAESAPVTPETYTVTFNANGGSPVAPQLVTAKTQASAPAPPARVGYRFVGWYSDRALRQPFDFTAPIPGDLTLYAKWAASMNATAASGQASGSSQSTLNARTAASRATSGEKATASSKRATSSAQSSTPKKRDSSTSPAAASASAGADKRTPATESAPAAPPAAKAAAIASVPVARAQSSENTATAAVSAAAPALAEPAPTPAVASALPSAAASSAVGATPAPVPAAVVYVVDFDSGGGSDVAMQALEAGDVASEPAPPVRAGYRFAGWYADSDYSRVFDFTVPVRSRTTVYAKWEALADSRLSITSAGSLYLNGGSITLTAALLSGAALSEPAAVSWRVALRRDGVDLNAGGARYYDFAAESATCRIVQPLAAGGAYELYAEATYNGVTSTAVLPVTVDARLRFTAAQVTSGALAAAIGALSANAAVTVTGAASAGLCRALSDALKRTERAIELDLSQVTALTALEEGAFAGCASLSAVSLPSSLATIAPRAFSDCASLSSVRFAVTDGWLFTAPDASPIPAAVDNAVVTARLLTASTAGWATGTLTRAGTQ